MTAVGKGDLPTPVTAALDVALPGGELESQVQAGLDAVEARLRQAVSQADPLADDVARHLVLAGGKRVRPMLTLLASHLGDASKPEIQDAAVVVELTHLASLYHDDVMDGAERRRGAPSAHQVWGNSVAILTGDLLFARASSIVAGLGPDAVRILALTYERLCLGQLHEAIGPRGEEDPVAHYLQVLSDKTGSLLATSARFGALFSGCDAVIQDVLVAYGEQVGVAFQLADDVLDLSISPATTGKTPGTDLRERVPTLPTLLLRRAVMSPDPDPEAVALVAALDGDLQDDAVLAEVVARLAAHPATAQARAEAHHRATAAVDCLSALPHGEVRQALEEFARAVVDRTA